MHGQLLMVALVLAAPAPADDKKDIQGTWTVVSAVRSGEKEPEDAVKKLGYVIKDDTITMLKDGKDVGTYTFKLDAAKSPKAIDATLQLGHGLTERPALGIYELKGDELKLCFAQGKGARPTEFASKPRSEHNLIVLKREKKAK
jgi:uncharacterized protein (TIGR03067 family)